MSMKCMTRSVSLGFIKLSLFAAAGLMTQPASAGLAAMIAIDASAQKEALSTSYLDLATSLGKASGQAVRIDRSANFAEILRSTRTGEYDIYIMPGHVAASALTHGYTVIAASDKQETFVLVTHSDIQSVGQLKSRKLYLAQQDSIQSFMAKGLLNESGMSLKELGQVQYRNTSGAGLIAVELWVVDATVVGRTEFDRWSKSRSNQLKALLESKPIPVGMSLLVKKTMSATEQDGLKKWALTGQSAQGGVGQLGSVSEFATVGYKYLGGLGNFTPIQLPGVTRITADKAAAMIKQGAQMVDVRSEKEFSAKHIPGAVLITYTEKSAKDVSFDAKADDFSALAKLDKSKPTIFSCNGAECWKSYKASQVALSNDFKQVFWLRGGLPEWEEQGLPLVAN
jgi:rhodanese-related sulfurtransferase